MLFESPTTADEDPVLVVNCCWRLVSPVGGVHTVLGVVLVESKANSTLRQLFTVSGEIVGAVCDVPLVAVDFVH